MILTNNQVLHYIIMPLLSVVVSWFDFFLLFWKLYILIHESSYSYEHTTTSTYGPIDLEIIHEVTIGVSLWMRMSLKNLKFETSWIGSTTKVLFRSIEFL
jgi:hypothetical protein